MEEIIVKKILNKKINCFLLALSAVVLPHSVFASTMYIDTDRSDFFVGDTVLFRVRVDSENKNINVVEGNILLNDSTGAVSLANMNTAGSLFSLWPNKPLPSENNTSISFVGGSPRGLIANDAIVFNMALKLQKEGQVTLSPRNIEVYLNDGQGTKDKVSVRDFTITVAPGMDGVPVTDDLGLILAKDKTPPASFEPTLGKDPSLFENRSFLSFFTTDVGSGIAYYEVQEGDGAFVQVESPYVLQDQSLRSLIRVKAVDRAGNEKVVEFKPAPPTTAFVPFDSRLAMWVAGIVLAFFAVASLLWKVISRKK